MILLYFAYQNNLVMSESEIVNKIQSHLNSGKNYLEAIRLSEFLTKKYPNKIEYKMYLVLSLTGRLSAITLAEKQRLALDYDLQLYKKHLDEWEKEYKNPDSKWFNKRKPEIPRLRTWDDGKQYRLSPEETKDFIKLSEEKITLICRDIIEAVSDPIEKSDLYMQIAWVKFILWNNKNEKSVYPLPIPDFIDDAKKSLELNATEENYENLGDLYFLTNKKYVYPSQKEYKTAFYFYKNAIKDKKNENLNAKLLLLSVFIPDYDKEDYDFIDSYVLGNFEDMNKISPDNAVNFLMKSDIYCRLGNFNPKKYNLEGVKTQIERSLNCRNFYMPKFSYSKYKYIDSMLKYSLFTDYYFMFLDNFSGYTSTYIDKNVKQIDEKLNIFRKITYSLTKYKIETIIDFYCHSLIINNVYSANFLKKIRDANSDLFEEGREEELEKLENEEFGLLKKVIADLRSKDEQQYYTRPPWEKQ